MLHKPTVLEMKLVSAEKNAETADYIMVLFAAVIYS